MGAAVEGGDVFVVRPGIGGGTPLTAAVVGGHCGAGTSGGGIDGGSEPSSIWSRSSFGVAGESSSPDEMPEKIDPNVAPAPDEAVRPVPDSVSVALICSRSISGAASPKSRQ